MCELCKEEMIEHPADGDLHKKTMSLWCELPPDIGHQGYKTHKIQKGIRA